MLEKIIHWGKNEEAVKALILLGSRASQQPVDYLSDYDISVYCNTYENYIQSEAWLNQFGKVWVCIKEKISFGGKIYPTRLVIFEGGIKVDFTFLDMTALDELVGSTPLSDNYNLGYKILLDKENKTSGLQTPQFAIKAIKPTEQEFYEVIKEFWFETYHIGVYLKRRDLWSVKFRSCAAQAFLLRMIEWHVQGNNKWKIATLPIGKRMTSWVDEGVWNNLHGIFAHFDAEDSWKGLFNMMELFQKLAATVAENLGFRVQEDLSKNMIGFITTLRNSL